MDLTDDIRRYVAENILIPARSRGIREVMVRSGDVHSAMGLSSRMPAVCSALGTKMDQFVDVEVVNMTGVQGANFYVTYRFLGDGGTHASPQQANEEVKEPRHLPEPTLKRPRLEPYPLRGQVVPPQLDGIDPALIDILGGIPPDAWTRITVEEPEWKMMQPFLERYGFGRFAVLMMTLGLNDFQNKGKAEVGFWPPLKALIERSPVPNTPAELDAMLTPFFQNERLASLKLERQARFLSSDLARTLWDSSPDYVARDFIRVWKALGRVMGQSEDKKTIVFSMKCLGIALLFAGRHDFDFTPIPIPVDSRVVNLTRRLGCETDNPDRVRAYWREALQRLRKTHPGLNMIHLDSLVWQIGTLSDAEMLRHFENLGIGDVGKRLVTHLQTIPAISTDAVQVTLDTPPTVVKKSGPIERQPNPTRTGAALVLIPCCSRKVVIPADTGVEPLQGIQQMRERLMELVRKTDAIATRPENTEGVLAPDAPPVMALDLYSMGNFYSIVNGELRDIAAGKYPGIHVLILSALYGLVRPDEGLRMYDLMMSDHLDDGRRVYRFWQDAGIDRVLEAYVSEHHITHVWSLLPDSTPQFPYQQTLEKFWQKALAAGVAINHKRVRAGSNTGRETARWLKETLATDPGRLLTD